MSVCTVCSASAWILCRASQGNAQGESLVVLAKEGFKALYCLHAQPLSLDGSTL